MYDEQRPFAKLGRAEASHGGNWELGGKLNARPDSLGSDGPGGGGRASLPLPLLEAYSGPPEYLSAKRSKTDPW